MEDTVEALREQLAQANDNNKTLTAKVDELSKTNKEQAVRIEELITYNNKLFARVGVEDNEPVEKPKETEADVVNDIIKLMNKGRK